MIQLADRMIVIGGGIVGLCSALALQRRGVPTILIDPARETPAASWGNAGHIAIEQVDPLASMAMLRSAPRRLSLLGGPLSLPPRQIGTWLPFVIRLASAARPDRFAHGRAALGNLLAQAMPAWERLAAGLQPRDLLLASGHAVVWHRAAAASEGIATYRKADTGTARYHIASPEEIAWLGTAMRTPPSGAVIFENTAQVADPGAVLAALSDAFREAGGDRRTGQVRRFVIEKDAAALILDSGETLHPKRILLAAGVESGDLLAPLGINAPVIAERGYHIQSARHRCPPGMPPIVFEERATIVTRFDSGLRVAGFVELSQREASPDAAKWQRLQRHAIDLGLPANGPWLPWFGSRPTLPDYLPAIGRATAVSNLFYAFGHQHLGLTLGPITGEIVAAMMAEQAPPVPILPFDLNRFG